MNRPVAIFAVCFLLLSGSLASAQEMEARIYELKFRSPKELMEVIQPFLVGGTQVQPSQTFNTLTIRASREVHAQIENLLSEYDQPLKSIEFQFYLLKADRGGQGLTNGVPEHVKAVLDEISSLTAYKSFQLLDAPLLRTREGGRGIVSSEGTIHYSLRLLPGVHGEDRDVIDARNFVLQVHNGPRIETSFSIQNGETMVLGTSRVGGPDAEGTALITVVTARIL